MYRADTIDITPIRPEHLLLVVPLPESKATLVVLLNSQVVNSFIRDVARPMSATSCGLIVGLAARCEAASAS